MEIPGVSGWHNTHAVHFFLACSDLAFLLTLAAVLLDVLGCAPPRGQRLDLGGLLIVPLVDSLTD